MTTLLLSISIIIFLLIALLFYKKLSHTTELEHTLATKETELANLQHSEENLRTELNTMEMKLNHAMEDPLTGLLGWTLFEDRVRQGINESDRYQFNMALLYIDINDFRMINEALSYEVGDMVLSEVSKRLRASIREADSISRLSKDVFAVLLTQLGKPETAAIVCQRMLEVIAQPITVNEHVLYLTACIGISSYPAEGVDVGTLFRNADLALAMAKEKGAQHYHFYHEKNYASRLRELGLSTGLKRDSFLEECEIYYQPIMHEKDKKLFCMEALMCWRHPELGLIHSEELFNYIQKYDANYSATEWLIKKACRQFVAWRNSGLKAELLCISISIKQLGNTQFIYRITKILQECAFQSEWLMLMIEDNISQIAFENVEKGFNMLKYLNVKLAINHFGAGLFSIQDLKNFTVDYLRLEGSMISDIAQNKKTLEMIRAIDMLAQSLSMQLIIQGVGTEKQMLALEELDIDLVQGQFVGEVRLENTEL